MKTANVIRISYNAKSVIGKWFREYKGYVIFFSIIALLGFVTGIMTAVKLGKDLEVDHLPSKAIRLIMDNPKNNWGYFVQQLLSLTIMIVVFMFCQFHPIMILVDVLLIVYHFYCFGFCFLGIILIHTIVGFLNVIIFIFPFHLCFGWILVLILAIGYKQCKVVKRFGKLSHCHTSKKDNKWIVIILVALMLVLLLIQTLLLPLVSITIINV